jgi:SAM-dependent methyltransferase
MTQKELQEDACPVCAGASALIDVVDFNKSCEEVRGKFLPLAGIPIYYSLCAQCGFCFAPEFSRWTLEDFESRIYNDSYVQVDPDYLDVRPRANAQGLVGMFGDRGQEIRHLDYGGGNGLLSDALRKAGWQSASYDPFVDRETDPGALGEFDLITAYEVFEHVPDVRQLASNLSSLLAADGVVLFSTLVSDGNLGPRQRLAWWYASPRNGHISLFSRQSLSVLGATEGFNFGSFSAVSHAFWRRIPPWAAHIFRNG